MTLLQKLAAFQRGRHSRPEGQRVWRSACGFPRCFCAHSKRCHENPHDDGTAASLWSSSTSQRFAFLFSGHQGREGGSDRWSSIPSRLQYQMSQTPQGPWVSAARGLSLNYMTANVQENTPDVQVKVLHQPFPVSGSRK